MMSEMSRLFCGITLLTVPSIAYGGYFLLTIVSGYFKQPLTDFQRTMFRAGHAHAGVLVILSLIAQPLIDNTVLSSGWQLTLRIGFPLSAVVMSGGFFAAAAGKGRTQPNRFIGLLYAGVGLLLASVVGLGVTLISA